MQTWKIEATVHAALLAAVMLAQHGWQPRAVPGPAWALLGALVAFGAVGRITDRLAERMRSEGAPQPTVECAAKLPQALWAGRVLLAIYLALLGAWVSLASLAWDCLYPSWRRAYRARRPYGREALPPIRLNEPEAETAPGGPPLTFRRK